MSQELPPSEQPSQPPRSSWEDEKEREKEREKEQEKEREKENEKSQEAGEKFRRDPISGAFWAGVLILAGLVFMADNLGYLPEVGNADAWHWIAFGAGVALFLEALVRTFSPDHARPVTGRFIFSGILIVIGASGIVGTETTWPLILIVAGIGILLGTLLRKR